MNKPTFSERSRYWFDNWMSRGTLALMALLAIATAILVLVVGVLVAIFRQTLERLNDLPIVGDVRGDGYFFGIELVKDKATKETFDSDESERMLRGFLSKALFDAGLYCRADDRGDPVIQLAPPLTIGPAEFDDIESRLRSVLTEAEKHI